MYSFNYNRAKSVAEAAAALAKSPDAKLLAGGQSLIAAMKLRLAKPSDLIDLGTIAELRGIKVDAKSVTLGAMTRHAEVAASPEVRKAIPALVASVKIQKKLTSTRSNGGCTSARIAAPIVIVAAAAKLARQKANAITKKRAMIAIVNPSSPWRAAPGARGRIASDFPT